MITMSKIQSCLLSHLNHHKHYMTMTLPHWETLAKIFHYGDLKSIYINFIFFGSLGIFSYSHWPSPPTKSHFWCLFFFLFFLGFNTHPFFSNLLMIWLGTLPITLPLWLAYPPRSTSTPPKSLLQHFKKSRGIPIL